MRASLTFNTLLGLLAISCPVEAGTPAVGAPPAVALEAPAREGPAFTASLGLGYGYGIYGVQIRNDRSLRPWLHLSPFVAGGINPSFGWTSIVGAFGLSAFSSSAPASPSPGTLPRVCAATVRAGARVWPNAAARQLDRDVILSIASDGGSIVELPDNPEFRAAPPTSAASPANGVGPAGELRCALPAQW